MNKSAEQNIIDFLRSNPSKYASASLQRMEFRNKNGTVASPKAISRRLQENAEGDHAVLEVSYDDHNNSHYQIKQELRKKEQVVTRLPNGSVKIEYV
jgi:hypothetical protein